MYINVCIFVVFNYVYVDSKDMIVSGGALDFSISNLGFCLELGLLNSETQIGTGVA